MAKKNINKTGNRNSESDLLKKPKEVLVKYIMHLENDWYKFSEENLKLKKKVSELEKEIIKPAEAKVNLKKYNKSGSWIDKLIFILDKNSNPMTIEEIKNQFLLYEPSIKFQWSNLDNQISQLLYRACMAKAITKKKVKGENKYFI